MPQPAGPQDAEAFVGRAHELAVLSAALHQAATGDARLALISGEPGIGKTELARAFARAAAASGALVLWGSAWEDGGAPPYWPWVQVLRSYARQAGPEALAAAAGPQAAVLAQLLPELGPVQELTGSGDAARLTLFDAVGAVLDRASRAAPLAVILDDLHAAGPPVGAAAALRGGRAAVPGPAARHLPHRRGGPGPGRQRRDRRAGVGQPAAGPGGPFRRGHPAHAARRRRRRARRRAAPQRGQPAVRIPGGALARPRRGHGRGGAGPGRHPAGRPPPGRQARAQADDRGRDRRQHPYRPGNPGHRRGARPGHRPGPGRGGAGRPGRTGGPAVRRRHRRRPARPGPGRRRGVPVPARADQGNPLRRALAAVPGPGAPPDRRGAGEQRGARPRRTGLPLPAGRPRQRRSRRPGRAPFPAGRRRTR